MKLILRTIYFMQLCCHALGALPAPVNVTIESLNFNHSLRWDPGIGTPAGTMYRIIISPCRKTQKELHVPHSSVNTVKWTLGNCTKNYRKKYTIHVKAINGDMESPWSNRSFTPYTDTILGPPEVSVAGCGDCLNLTITLPRGEDHDSISNIFHKFNFHIFWKQAGNSQVLNTETSKSSVVLKHLVPGVEYCVRVQPELNVNEHILSSNWTCAFTSLPDRSPAPLIFAGLSVALIMGGVVLLVLYHVGFLCKLKLHLPRVLSSLVGTQYLLTAQNFPDLISVITDAGGQGRGSDKAVQLLRDSSDEEEEDEEEAERNDGYENRAGFSGKSTSSSVSHNTAPSAVSLNTASTAESSGTSNWMAEQELSPLGDQGQGESEEPRLQELGGDLDLEHHGDVNLMSVTLGALEEEEEGEKDGGDMTESVGDLQERDSSSECQLLLSADNGEGPAGQSSAQTEAPGMIYTAHPPLTHSDCQQTPSHCLQTHTDCTQVEEDEEEEDQDCSGYVGR